MNSQAFVAAPPTCGLYQQQFDCYWLPKFSEGQNANPTALNKRYIDALQAAWKGEDDDEDEEVKRADGGEHVPAGSRQQGDERNDDIGEDGAPEEAEEPLNTEDSCVARVFMRGRCHLGPSEMMETYHRGAEYVEGFCSHINFEDLQEPEATRAETEPLALLEESSQAGAFRKSRGSMNSVQLYTVLQQERVAVETVREPLGKNGSGRKRQEAQPDADQRRLYIHNITPRAAAVLMATTSAHEAPAVRDLLHLHLTRGTEIRVQIPTHGFRTFTFILSLPYYTMKKGPHLADARRCSSGELLRKTVAIPISGKPRRTSAGDIELHEAQTTIALTGIDEARWTAIGLVDSTRVTASVRHYDAGLLPDRVQREDPIAGGSLGPDNHAFNPRLYFLWIWEARITQADAEWDSIIGSVDRSVTDMWDDDPLILPSTQSDYASERVQDSVSTQARLVSSLRRVKHSLSKTIGAWRQFQDSDIKYFQDGTIQSEAAMRAMEALRAIEGVYSRLRLKLEDLCEMIRELGTNHLNNTPAAEAAPGTLTASTPQVSSFQEDIQVSRRTQDPPHDQIKARSVPYRFHHTNMVRRCRKPVPESFDATQGDAVMVAEPGKASNGEGNPYASESDVAGQGGTAARDRLQATQDNGASELPGAATALGHSAPVIRPRALTTRAATRGAPVSPTPPPHPPPPSPMVHNPTCLSGTSGPATAGDRMLKPTLCRSRSLSLSQDCCRSRESCAWAQGKYSGPKSRPRKRVAKADGGWSAVREGESEAGYQSNEDRKHRKGQRGKQDSSTVAKVVTMAQPRQLTQAEKSILEEEARFKNFEARAQSWREKAAEGDFDDDLYIVDPEAHNGLLSALEARVLRESEFARRRGNYSQTRPEDDVSLRVTCPIPIPEEMSKYIEDEKMFQHGDNRRIMESYLLLTRIISHLDNLRSHGFAQGYFSILVERWIYTAAEVVPLYRSSLVGLREVLATKIHALAALGKAAQPPNLGQRFVAALEELTRGLGPNFVDRVTKSRGLSTARSWDCRWLMWVLELGLISYAGSHASRFDSQFGAAAGRINIPPPEGHDTSAVEVSLRGLTCLAGFLDVKVWVFRITSDGKSSAHRSDEPLPILTTMPHFADLWGPVYTVRQPQGIGSGRDILQYNTAKGVIRSTGEMTQLAMSGLDGSLAICCHWEPAPTHFLSRCSRGIRKLFKPPKALLHDSDTLLIGQSLETNESCPYTLDSFQADFGHVLGVPGARPESWEVDGLAASVSLPRYFNFSITGTKKKIPATTLKQLIRDKWISNPSRANPWVLHRSLGVEISHCTGNASRVPLKHLLLHEAVSKHLDIQMPSWPLSDWGSAMRQALASPNPDDILQFWKSHLQSRSDVGGLVSSLLEMLDDTGSDRRVFRAVLLNKNMEHLLEMSLSRNSWAHILGNSETAAAYALVTNSCLGHPRGGGAAHPRDDDGCTRCSQDRRLEGERARAFTCLQTRLSSTAGPSAGPVELRADRQRLRYAWGEGGMLVPLESGNSSMARILRGVKGGPSSSSPSRQEMSEVLDDIRGILPVVRLRAQLRSFGGMATPRSWAPEATAVLALGGGGPRLGPSGESARPPPAGAGDVVNWAQAWASDQVATGQHNCIHGASTLLPGRLAECRPASSRTAAAALAPVFDPAVAAAAVASVPIAIKGIQSFLPLTNTGQGMGILVNEHSPLAVVPRPV